MTTKTPHQWRDALRELLLEHSVRTGSFTLASGETSSVYVDVRKTSLRGDGARLIGEAFWELVGRHCPEVDGVGGPTLGADPLVVATAIAARDDGGQLDALIVRKKAKGHGTGAFVETPGGLPEGAKVVVVEDTITTGGSIVFAIEKLREAGFVVEHALCVVDREAGGEAILADHGVTLRAVFRLSELVAPEDAA